MSDTPSEIQNALTPDDWREGVWKRGIIAIAGGNGVLTVSMGTSIVCIGGDEVHAAAALCLYNQPFGFTREDVDIVKSASADVESLHNEFCGGKCRDDCLSRIQRLLAIAMRINALLPPEDSNG